MTPTLNQLKKNRIIYWHSKTNSRYMKIVKNHTISNCNISKIKWKCLCIKTNKMNV